MKARLQKILAQAGVASRRKCEDLIKEGRVKVNDRIATIGESADPDKDSIRVDNERIRLEKKVYLMLNKPKDYIVSVSDEYGRRTVMQLVPARERLFPVGRLDRDAEGLLLMTNDGNLANCLMHPRFEVEKEYYVTLATEIKKEDVEKLRSGFVIDRRKVIPKAKLLDRNKLTLSIHEGRKHIVKRLFWRLGYRVTRLQRVRIGPLILSGISSGHYRQLSSQELENLWKLCQQQLQKG